VQNAQQVYTVSGYEVELSKQELQSLQLMVVGSVSTSATQ
jgi:hypothetical protein